MAKVDHTVLRQADHGNPPDTADRRMITDDVSTTSSAAAAVITGNWIDARQLRKVGAYAKGASATLTVAIDIDYMGDSTVGETVSATLANPSILATRDILARQVRLKITNGGTIQNITGIVLVGD